MKETKSLWKKVAIFAAAAFAACVMLVANPVNAKAATPAKVTGLTVSYMGSDRGVYYLTWDLQADAYRYDIEVYNAKSQLVTTGNIGQGYMSSAKSYSIYENSLKNKIFMFRVRAYSTDGKGNYTYGEWSDMKVIVPTAKVKRVTNLGGGSVKVKWNKVSGAKSYTVYKRVGTKGKFKKVKTVKGTSCDVSGFKASKQGAVYVIANKVKVNGKNYSTIKIDDMAYIYFTYSNYTSYWKR